MRCQRGVSVTPIESRHLLLLPRSKDKTGDLVEEEKPEWEAMMLGRQVMGRSGEP